MSNTVICVVYVDYCLFWSCSQDDIVIVMNYFKEDGTSYNWEQSMVKSVSEFLNIDRKTLNDGGFQFYKTGLICKVLEAT